MTPGFGRDFGGNPERVVRPGSDLAGRGFGRDAAEQRELAGRSQTRKAVGATRRTIQNAPSD